MDTRALIVAFALIPGGCYSCIAWGTRVDTPAGPVPIERLRVGDRVFSVDTTTGRRLEVTITAIRSAVRECVSLALPGGVQLVCTPDHPVFDPSRQIYRNAGHWITGEASQLLEVTEAESRPIALVGREAYAGVHRVFDLTVDGPHHNFVANGVVVHNKSSVDGYGVSYGYTVGDGDGDGDGDISNDWFDATSEIPCPDPLPDGDACVTVEGKEFHFTNGSARLDAGDVIYELEPAPGAPTLMLRHTTGETGSLTCGAEVALQLQFQAATISDHGDECTLEIDPVDPSVGDPISGDIELQLAGSYDGFSTEFDALAVWRSIPIE